MIPITSFGGRAVAVFGLGGSGLVTAEALAAGGAKPIVWDDGEAGRKAAADKGLDVRDLNEIDWSDVAALVLSPGVPLTHPKPHWSVKLASAHGVEVIGDIELFVRERRLRAPGSPFIAITGTNGKSTTTALIAHLFAAAGRDVQLGGNIGTAILSLDPPSPDRVHVVECSSYQIDLAPSIDPSVAILLNVTEDHLDRHGTLEHYAAVKARLVEGADTPVVGVDDAWCAAIADAIEAKGGRPVRISVESQLSEGVYAVGDRLFSAEAGRAVEVASLAGIGSLRGAHNAQNACAALAAARAGGLTLYQIQAGMRSFPGLAHRMEQVGRLGPVLFVNDSKATNADAAAKALSSFPTLYWIAGGKPKTGGIESLAEYFPKIRKAYLIGEASEEFAATLEGRVPYVRAETIEKAVPLAAADAAASGLEEAVVLLSPACASFDQFRNFEERGKAFSRAVLALPGIGKA
ncbi:UDP-N-acetylmuramoyl-L-alanine--D-glutamate ligase [Labrys okinawensis]|uniref:UDP-N-acetylmuramoylalanine--D-glutamate ligase n=1 Tax=Labrys okinawensis TaxID=346911 RepID=A0A2S9QCV7_9HYPH|nr:UDP-N-acetylmuramoyl-L-alanine--D-glutamate ligase [Labrys okinawensis]PRH87155.1 UDP-N-acetylmuramoyl-L-alanine--D-glutamate ligase [Labrys okinawensis]